MDIWGDYDQWATDYQVQVAMTVLDESPDHVTVLMLFDGPKGGRPSIYRIDWV